MIISNWLIFLIGLAVGGVLGIFAGVLLADEHWRRKVRHYDKLIYANEAPYEIVVKGDKQDV